MSPLSRNSFYSLRMRQYLPLLLLCFVVAAALSACATSRSSIPPAVTDFPSYQFEALSGSGVRLSVLDQRSERSDSDLLVSRMRESLTTALTSSGVSVTETAGLELEVRITQLRSDFELGNWQGCTRMSARLQSGETDERVEADRCVTRSNMYGYRSANEALAASFRDALAQLLSELDAL